MEQSVAVGATGFYTEFLLHDAHHSNAYIKNTFATTKKHFTEIERAVQKSMHSKHLVLPKQQAEVPKHEPVPVIINERARNAAIPSETKVQRTSITIAELLNPMEQQAC